MTPFAFPDAASASVPLDVLSIAAIGILVKVTILLGATSVLVWALRRASAATRHFVWMLGLGGSLLIPLLAVAPRLNVPVPSRWLPSQFAMGRMAEPGARVLSATEMKPETQSAALQPAKSSQSVGWSSSLVGPASALNPKPGAFSPNASPGPHGGAFYEFDVRTPPRGDPIVTGQLTMAVGSRSKAPVLLVIWLIGALALLSWRGVGYLLLARLLRHSTPVIDATWHDTLQTVVNEHGVTREIRLLQHRAFHSPVTAGWRRSVIVLPTNLGATPRERQLAVIAHEVAHIRRYDFIMQAMAAMVTSIFWFHPLVWFAASRLRAESECAADDSALRRGIPAERYAHHLLALADGSRGWVSNPLPIVGMARHTQLEHRLRALLDASVSRRELSGVAARLVTAGSLLVVVPFASVGLIAVEPTVLTSEASVAERQGGFADRAEAGAVTGAGIPRTRPDIMPRTRAVSAIDEDSARIIQSAANARRGAELVANNAYSGGGVQLGGQRADGLMSGRIQNGLPLIAARDTVLPDPTSAELNAARKLSTEADSVVEQSVPMQSGEMLTIDIRSGANVVLRGWDEPKAKLRATLGGAAWRQAHAQIVRSASGAYVTAMSEREGFRINQVSGEYFHPESPVKGQWPPIPTSVDHLIEVWLPRRTNIVLHSTRGNVRIQDIDGEVGASSRTGNIEVIGARGTALLAVQIGDIRVSNSALKGSARTQCGNVSLSGVTGSFSATSDYDPAPFKSEPPGYRILIIDGVRMGDYCNARQQQFGLLPNRVNESRPYGDIVLDSAPTGGTLSTGRDGSISVRASGGHMSASTNRGNIELSKVRGDATARSARGNITVQLINTDGTEHYVIAQTSNGTVTIELPDSLDAIVEASVVTSDSSAARGRYSRIVDEYGLAKGAPGASESGRITAGGDGALTASVNATRGLGTGRILVHVTDGDIIFKRAKR